MDETKPNERGGMRESALENHGATGTEKTGKRAGRGPKAIAPECAGGFLVRVDFAPAAYLFEEIKKRADAEFRDLGGQILWELAGAMGVRG